MLLWFKLLVWLINHVRSLRTEFGLFWNEVFVHVLNYGEKARYSNMLLNFVNDTINWFGYVSQMGSLEKSNFLKLNLILSDLQDKLIYSLLHVINFKKDIVPIIHHHWKWDFPQFYMIYFNLLWFCPIYYDLCIINRKYYNQIY